MKNIITIIFSLFINCASGQTDKLFVKKHFDKIVYYSDSTISSAFNLKGKKKEGYSIEFDLKGQPIAIGKYFHNKKHSWWIFSNNFSDFYVDGIVSEDLIPSCSTGKSEDFNKLYSDLIHGIIK